MQYTFKFQYITGDINGNLVVMKIRLYADDEIIFGGQSFPLKMAKKNM